jgi:hypothetical protein
MAKGIDVDQDVTDYAGAIKRAGYDFVGRYLPYSTKSDPLTGSEAAHLSRQGLSVYSFWESGFPTAPDYFTWGQAAHDASLAFKGAKWVGMPSGHPSFFTVDYDADPQDVKEYFQALHTSPYHQSGYAVGVYASDAVCRAISEWGYASYFCVAYSNGGWRGSDNPIDFGGSRQGAEVKNFLGFGLDVDLQESSGNYTGWRIAQSGA